MDLHCIDLAPHIRAAWTPDGTPEALAQALGARVALFPKQVHGTRVEPVDLAITNEPDADGLVTGSPGLLIGVRTADCLPILLSHRTESMIAAVHGGWRGLAAGILQTVTERIEGSGWRLAECVGFLGPSIGPCCYEVGPEVGERFGNHFNGKMLDLKGFVREYLVALGIGTIFEEPSCTQCRSDLPSYRRNPSCGRILTGIVIQPDDGCQ